MAKAGPELQIWRGFANLKGGCALVVAQESWSGWDNVGGYKAEQEKFIQIAGLQLVFVKFFY